MLPISMCRSFSTRPAGGRLESILPTGLEHRMCDYGLISRPPGQWTQMCSGRHPTRRAGSTPNFCFPPFFRESANRPCRMCELTYISSLYSFTLALFLFSCSLRCTACTFVLRTLFLSLSYTFMSISINHVSPLSTHHSFTVLS